MPAKHPPTVKIHCLCGKYPVFDRVRVLEKLGKERWKCTACKRRFIVACTPATEHGHEKYWPIFLDDVPVRGDTQEMGLVSVGAESAEVPAHLQFECRCGCRLMGEARMYGRRTRCPKCDARIVVRLGYEDDTGKPIALLEYPDTGAR